MQPAFNAILGGDLAGNTLNVTYWLILAAKTQKVQLGILADAAAALGAAIGASNSALAQSLSAAIAQNFTGKRMAMLW
jgi:dTDP-4-amino-4,6-dideoxygalactose transaminase